MRDAGAGQYLIVKVDAEFVFFQNQREEVENVARIKLAGMNGHFSRQIHGREQGDSGDGLRDSRLGQLAIAAGGSGQIDQH